MSKTFKDAVEFNKHDRVLGILPFFHSFGYTVTLWGTLLRRRCRPCSTPIREPRKEVGELCRIHGCTLMAATATFLRMYLRRCGPDDFKIDASAGLWRGETAAVGD